LESLDHVPSGPSRGHEFNALTISEYISFVLSANVFTEVMTAKNTSATINPYSIAVAPLSSRRKPRSSLFKFFAIAWPPRRLLQKITQLRR
jgi:hypothetical protein